MSEVNNSIKNAPPQHSACSHIGLPNKVHKTGIAIDSIKNEAKKLLNTSTPKSENVGLLRIKTANAWIEEAKPKPVPKRLFDDFWIEGEMCCLYSDTNRGKSILGVQIGDSISTGSPIPGFVMDALAQPVLYYDFELSEKQFENRYSIDYAQHYFFSNNFCRAVLNPEAVLPDGLTSVGEYLLRSLEESIIQTGARKLLIDNLTYLEREAEKAKYALVLMQHLKNLKSKYGLSILVMGHTPKRYVAKPLTIDDLQGSKMIGNFLDSAFVIGDSSKGISFRYLKQTKHRDGEHRYHADNVCLCEIVKPGNFTRFDHKGFSSEREELQVHTPLDRPALMEAAKELHNSGLSYRKVADQLGISHQTAARYIRE